jgi:hypothetical protein
MSSTRHLVQMANDIENFFGLQPRHEAIAGIAAYLE